jgi:hypothetical protein
MFQRHQIIELPVIPRKKDELQALIGEAREQRRRARMINMASICVVVLALAIMTFGSMARVPSRHSTNDPYTRQYLPLIHQL